VSVRTMPRHRKVAGDRSGSAEGNARLTAMTGTVLLVLLAVEGVTIAAFLLRHELLNLHFFFGFVLVGPVLLKLGSTGYRFTRYYTHAEPYVRKGPPVLLLRLLGPVVIVTSAGVLASGIGLAFFGAQALLLLAHKAFFIVWFAAMTIHVLWYAPRLPRLLTSYRSAGRPRITLPGGDVRWLLVLASLACGLVLAVATYHLAGHWTPEPGSKSP
jgi:hypothetical protein